MSSQCLLPSPCLTRKLLRSAKACCTCCLVVWYRFSVALRAFSAFLNAACLVCHLCSRVLERASNGCSLVGILLTLLFLSRLSPLRFNGCPKTPPVRAHIFLLRCSPSRSELPSSPVHWFCRPTKRTIRFCHFLFLLHFPMLPTFYHPHPDLSSPFCHFLKFS